MLAVANNSQSLSGGSAWADPVLSSARGLNGPLQTSTGPYANTAVVISHVMRPICAARDSRSAYGNNNNKKTTAISYIPSVCLFVRVYVCVRVFVPGAPIFGERENREYCNRKLIVFKKLSPTLYCHFKHLWLKVTYYCRLKSNKTNSKYLGN